MFFIFSFLPFFHSFIRIFHICHSMHFISLFQEPQRGCPEEDVKSRYQRPESAKSNAQHKVLKVCELQTSSFVRSRTSMYLLLPPFRRLTREHKKGGEERSAIFYKTEGLARTKPNVPSSNIPVNSLCLQCMLSTTTKTAVCLFLLTFVISVCTTIDAWGQIWLHLGIYVSPHVLSD